MAILGVLTIEPMSGYDMKRFSERSLAHFWHESYGNLYPRLRRLESAGLIRGRREIRDNAPDAIVYSLTTRGRRRFRRWLEEPPQSEHVRSELVLKLMFSAQTEPEIAVAMLRDHLREQLRIRKEYRETEKMLRRGSDRDPQLTFWLISLRRGQLLTEARLKWCRESLKLLEEMLEVPS